MPSLGRRNCCISALPTSCSWASSARPGKVLGSRTAKAQWEEQQCRVEKVGAPSCPWEHAHTGSLASCCSPGIPVSIPEKYTWKPRTWPSRWKSKVTSFLRGVLHSPASQLFSQPMGFYQAYSPYPIPGWANGDRHD